MIRHISLVALSFTCLFAAGCSCAYHAYTCGCVPLDYVAPAPLPYVQHQDCSRPATISQAIDTTEFQRNGQRR